MPDYIERRFPVFKAGTHKDSDGKERTWTPADLDHMVSTYDPTQHEAPVVIGHPKDNSPAFGWVKNLSREGDVLHAHAEIFPELDGMIQKGLFKKRSISLYEDGTLRHIGFLGAKPPAVKGLPDIQFGEGVETTIEFTDSNTKEGGNRMKFFDWIRQTAGKEGVTLEDLPTAGGTFSEEELKRRIDAARKEERDKATAEFSEAQKKTSDDLKAREERIRTQELETRKTLTASFCEALQKEGRLTPAMMKVGMGMTNFLEQIGAIEATIEFNEGEKKLAQTPLEFMQAFLRGLPKAIEFGEVATDDKDTGPKGQAAEKLDRLTKAKMGSDKALSYGAAFTEVQSENPDLARDYAEEIGR